jgi:hypothetical protein
MDARKRKRAQPQCSKRNKDQALQKSDRIGDHKANSRIF